MDLLLLPVDMHRRISRRMPGVFVAMLLVGVFDLAFYLDWNHTTILNGPPAHIALRLIALAAMAAVVGAVDVVCTIRPIADLARLVAKRREKYVSSGIHIVMMKVYALSHLLLVLPYAYLTFAGIDLDASPTTWSLSVKWGVSVALVLAQVLPFAQLGMLLRTLAVRSKLEVFPRLLVVSALYFWSRLTGEVVAYAVALAGLLAEKIG